MAESSNLAFVKQNGSLEIGERQIYLIRCGDLKGIMMKNADKRNDKICAECIKENYLYEFINNMDKIDLCVYCGLEHPTITLKDFSDRVHHALEHHFKLIPKSRDWEREPVRDSKYVADLIRDEAGIKPKIARDVVQFLSKRYSYVMVKEGEEDPYSDTSLYQRRDVDEWSLSSAWGVFQEEIRNHGRYYNQTAEARLNDIFGDISKLEQYALGDFVKSVEVDGKAAFWRARYAESKNEIESFLKDLHLKVGPPPSSKATSGRMNAEGISVFYGAEDLATCVAEIRAPVGGYVIAAMFDVISPLRLLDLSELAQIQVSGSIFDEAFAGLEDKAVFFNRLVNQMSRPVMPNDEKEQYLVTQVVAEYLASRIEPRFDGILYPSAQTGETGKNVVLFHHASKIEPYEKDDETEIEIRWIDESSCSDEFTDSTITGEAHVKVTEVVPLQPRFVKVGSEPLLFPTSEITFPDQSDLGYHRFFEYISRFKYSPTLRLNLDTLTIIQIEKMVPEISKFKISYQKSKFNWKTEQYIKSRMI